jgi:hypothetical protein
MPKKKNVNLQKQITVRVSQDIYTRIEFAANGLDIDSSDLIRMMFREKLPEYEERAAKAARPLNGRPNEPLTS